MTSPRNLPALALLLILGIGCVRGQVVYFGGCPVVWRSTNCDSHHVKFYLHTRDTKTGDGQFVRFNDDGTSNLTSSKYDPSKKTVLIVHGYADSPRLNSLQEIKNEYLKREPMNVWFLDWSSLCPGPCYMTSVYNLGYVGKCMASFVVGLGRPESNFHVIGFSLGGHAAGLAANYLRPYLIPRITGLDPALPLFVGFGHQTRLSPDDGKFVDVIHTNAFFQGNFLPMGHVDFFVNGGVRQPGCGSFIKSIQCSHERNPWYYAESINSEIGFWGWHCKKLSAAITGKCKISEPLHIMGDPCSNLTHGLIYVPTADRTPFARGRTKLIPEETTTKRNKE